MKLGIPVVGGIALITAMAMAPLSARAGTPSPITVAAGAAAQTYSATLGAFEPDPTGPPAPVCTNDAAGCDQETVNFTTAGFPAADSFALTMSPTYTPAAAGQCLDVAILDGTGAVLASNTCIASGTATTASHLVAGAYTIEVDADATTEPTAMQPFTASVAGLATDTSTGSGGGNSGGPAAPTFSHEVTVDPQRADGEPDLAISSDGQSMFSGAPYGFSTTISQAWKSADGGTQWTNLHGGCAVDQVRANCSRGGGDAEFELSAPATPGGPQSVQFVDLNGLDTISCAHSGNGGDTFTDVTTGGNPVAGAACDEVGTVPASCQMTPPGPGCPISDTSPNAPGTDRQWMQVWPKADQGNLAVADKLYMIFDTGETPGGDAAIFSNDNGQTWNLGCQTTGTSCLGGANGVGARPGPLVINPTLLQTVNGVTYPTLYEFMGTNTNGTEVNISCDGGLTWSNIPMATGEAGSTTTDFVVGAIDSAGNLYSTWATQNGNSDWLTYYSHTSGQAAKPGNCSTAVPGGAGTDWATPQPINGSGTTISNATGVHYAVMPWLTAGDPGRVDLAYYGTTASGINPASSINTWNLHLTQTTNGLSATPAFTDVVANDTPMHNNSICFSGIGCTAMAPPGDRNLLDFFQVKKDPAGRAVIIFTDDNNSAADPSANAGAGLISSVQQASGVSLFSSVGSVPPLSPKFLGQSTDVRSSTLSGACNSSAATVCDPTGDAQLAMVGHNLSGVQVPGADIAKLQVLNKDANTLEFLFTVKDLNSGPGCASSAPVNGSCAVVNTGTAGTFVPHTGAQWLATWHWNNDVYFAEATSDAAGNASYVAGKPLSVFSDGEPKALEYVSNTATTAATGSFDLSHNTIEVDVPLSAIGGVGTASDTGTNHELYGLTGWTGDSQSVSVPSVSGNLAFFDNIDQTAPLDVLVTAPVANAPEAPYASLLLGLGFLVVLGSLVVRRRRRGAHPV